MVRPTHFEIQSEIDPPQGRIVAAGELDIATTPSLRQAVEALIAQGAREILVDLRGLTFVDSSGLRLFIDLAERCTQEGWSLSLNRPSGQAFTVFQISGADEHLPFIEPPPGSGEPSAQ